MARAKFDPDKAKGSPPVPPPAGGDATRPITVSALGALITGALDASVPTPVAVLGEVSGANLRTHWYFSLKDEASVISCVMFASDAARSKVTPEDGRSVVALGRVGFFGRQGRVQLYVDRLIAAGEGELERRFRALCEELKKLGWFDAERKRPIPAFPRRIAVVTSRTGAALQDVIDTMRRRCPAVDIAVVDVRVQGDGAPAQIASAIRWLSAHHERLGIDAILVVRGGGSIEDLWAFNERIVADAIVHSAVPVVAAIGHETDTTIAELVADARAATPTQAAMRVSPDRAALIESLDATTHRLGALLTRHIRAERSRLDALLRRSGLADPRRTILDRRTTIARTQEALAAAMRTRLIDARLMVERLASNIAEVRPDRALSARRERIGIATHRLHRGMQSLLERRSSHAESVARELIIAGPASVLARGYSVTTNEKGVPIRSASGVAPGQRVRTRVADGAFESTVTGGTHKAAPSPTPDPLPARASPRPARRPDDPLQMRLF